MNILLVFPPVFASLTQPHSALPRLSATLRQAGHEVTVSDLNLACARWLVEEDGWASIQPLIDRRWEMLEAQATLTPAEQKHYMDLAWTAGRPAEAVRGEFLRAVRTLHDPVRGAVWGEYDAAARVLSRLWLGLSLAQSARAGTNDPALYYGRAALSSSAALLRQLEDEPDPVAAWCAVELEQTIRRTKAELVGMSVTSLSQLAPALKLARSVPATTRIVLGGNIVTRLSDVFSRRPELLEGVYAAVRYEGERPMLDLAAGRTREQTQNTIYVSGGRVTTNPVGQPLAADDLPTADFSDLDLRAYWAPELILPVVAGHGCDWGRCAFCNITLGYSATQHRDPAAVAGEIADLHRRYGSRLFTLYQESVSPARLEGIARGLCDAGVDVRWEATCELEPGFTPQLCSLLHRSGCRCLHFGLETIEPDVIARMDRNIDLAIADEVLRNVSDAGIMNAVTLISGFPGETREQAERTAQFVIDRADVMHSVSVSVYYISRGSPVDRDPERYGVSFKRDPDADLSLVVTDYEAGGMTADERNEHAVRLSHEMQSRGCVLPADPPLLFAARYETRYPSEIYRMSREALPAKADEGGVSLRPWTTVRSLRFPLDRIRRRFIHPLSASDPGGHHDDCGQAPSVFCCDMAADRVVRLAPQAQAVLELCDGRTLDELAPAVAARLSVTPEEARMICRGVLKLFGAFVTGGE